jgi:predicted DNA-binding transcriptional regulator YafY
VGSYTLHMPRGEGESDGGNRLIRLLRLMRMIEARPGLGSAELAEELQVSERTVFRDVDAMRVAGVPVKARRHVGAYEIEGEVLSSARGLEADELAALRVLVEEVAGKGQVPYLDAADRAVRRLAEQSSDAAREVAEKLRGRITVRLAPSADDPEAAAPVFQALQQAMLDNTRVSCRYETARLDGQEAVFDFSPWHLLAAERGWYVLGWRSDRESVRCLKVSRFISATSTGEAAHRATDFDLDAWLAGAWSMVPSPTKYDVSLLVDPEFVSTICEIRWHHSQESHPMPDGRWRLTFRVAGLDEIKWWILGRGPAVVVESPPELATEVALLARRTAARYDS